MTKNKKTSENLTIKDLIKAPFYYKTFTNPFSYKLATAYAIALIIILAIISVIKNNLENYSIISNTTVFFYSTIGVAAFFVIPFTLFYIFISSYEKTTISYPKGLLILAIIFLPFMILGNLIDYLAQYLANPAFATFSIFTIFILMIYSIIAFIFTIKNHYETTIPRTLSSIILMSLTFIMIFMSGYIMQIISLMR